MERRQTDDALRPRGPENRSKLPEHARPNRVEWRGEGDRWHPFPVSDMAGSSCSEGPRVLDQSLNAKREPRGGGSGQGWSRRALDRVGRISRQVGLTPAADTLMASFTTSQPTMGMIHLVNGKGVHERKCSPVCLSPGVALHGGCAAGARFRRLRPRAAPIQCRKRLGGLLKYYYRGAG